jgi:NitT/TauT family transport system permease protein
MAEAQSGLPPLNLDEPSKIEKIPLLVKIRPVYPFIIMIGIWQITAYFLHELMGDLFPYFGAIIFRAWELITGPLIKAIGVSNDTGFLTQIYSIFFANKLSFLDSLKFLSDSPLLWHVLSTAWRLPFSFAIASVVGITVGILMGRFAFWEGFFVPLLSVLLPIPALAWTPIAVIWFGNGDQTVIIVTAFAASLPIAMAVWTGVKTINPVWIRAAQSMNADKMTIFRTVVLPGSLPMILSGMRIGLARAWRAGVGAEAFAGIQWGLSAGIFDAQEYLDTAFMMVAIAVLGIFGYILEKVLFQPIETRTIIKWGMMEEMGGQDKKN